MRTSNLIAIIVGLLVLSMPFTFAETLALQYDANGNLLTGDGKFRVYNSLNQLSKVYNGSSAAGTLLEDLTYHPTEERILTKKTYNSTGTVIETVIYIDENFVRVVNTSGTYDFTYVKHEGQLVGQKNPDGTKLFIHTDHEGSTSLVTNEAGNIVENATYSPFGEILSGTNTSRFDYEGKEFDTVVGDYDFHFRKYNPQWGLFTQPDSLIQNVYDPQSLNRYSFERNNPYIYNDKDGHYLQYVVAGGIGGFLNLGKYWITHDEHTLGGGVGYFSAGAISGGIGIAGPLAAATSSAVGTGIERFVDGEELSNQDAIADYISSALIGGATAGFGELVLPATKEWLIKKPAGYVLSRTGNMFITNQFLSDIPKLLPISKPLPL